MARGHERIETNIGLMVILVLIVSSFGGLVTILPLFSQGNLLRPVEGIEPYPALQLAGRDVYVREGCYVCHSQMIRPFRAETERYGTTRWPASSSTTAPSSGGRGVPDRTCTGSAADTVTSGTACTW